MRLGRAFSYIFQDEHAISKLVMALILALLSLVPVFGLVALATLLGYLVDIVANIKSRRKHPLPTWVNWGEKIGSGAWVLLAIVVYNLPGLIFLAILAFVPGFFGPSESSIGTVSAITLLCLGPLVLAYTIGAWAALAVGITQYANDQLTGDLFAFGRNLGTVNRETTIIFQWIAYATAVNAVVLLLVLLPFVAIVLAITAHGHLIGQLALSLGRAAERRAMAA